MTHSQEAYEIVRQLLEDAKAKRTAFEIDIAAYELVLKKLEAHIATPTYEGVSPVGRNGYRRIPVIDQILLFGVYQPNYVFAIRDLVKWLIAKEIFLDSKAAYRGVNPQLHQRKNLFERTARGQYTLTQEGIQRGEQIATDLPR